MKQKREISVEIFLHSNINSNSTCVMYYIVYNILICSVHGTRKYYSDTFHILKELKDRNHNSIEDSTFNEL